MIQTTEQITQIIQSDSESAMLTLIAELVKEHKMGRGKEQRALYDRYMQEKQGVPILSRPKNHLDKVDRRIPNDFFGDIVDTKTGYMGNEVVVELDREKYKNDGEFDELDYDRDNEALRDFQLMNDTLDLNSEAVRKASAMGVSYRLLYVLEGSVDVKPMNLQPYEVVYIYDQSIYEPQLVLRYYEIEQVLDKYQTKYTVVEAYDQMNITYYIDNGRYEFRRDTSKGVDGVQPHLFDRIPIIPMKNNEQMLGDAEKVLNLIDAYDAITSSTASEIEQLRLAYMYVKGAGEYVDEDFVKRLEQTGIFGLSEDGEVGFVNKQVNAEVVKQLLEELRKNIYQFAKSIDMSNNFGGDMRVIGWQVALLNLENASKITERKFTRALREQYRMLTEYWRKVGFVDINYLDLQFRFTRNFPKDIYSEAQTLEILSNQVSMKTALGLMSFVDDPEDEIARMEMEREENPFRGANGNAGFGAERETDRSDDGAPGDDSGQGADTGV